MPGYASGDAELWYETLGLDAGAGPGVVLLHPTPVHHAFWLPVAERLAGRYSVVLPDLRGHGRSEPGGSAPITVEVLAKDIETLLDTLGIERALFAGCSIGGYTLFELWRRIPERIAGVAFCCSKPQPDAPANRLKRGQWIAEVRADGPVGFFDAMATSLVGTTARRLDPGKVDEVRAMMQPVTAETVISVQQGLALRPDSLPTAATITAPACVIAGGEDSSSRPAEMELLAEAIRGGKSEAVCQYHLLADAGHYAPWEQPEVVGSILESFFRLARA